MKRAISAGAWVFAFWYLGAIISSYLVTPDDLGPLFGVIAGAMFIGNPRGLIWRSANANKQAPTPGSAS
jgi:hypothetical protein